MGHQGALPKYDFQISYKKVLSRQVSKFSHQRCKRKLNKVGLLGALQENKLLEWAARAPSNVMPTLATRGHSKNKLLK